MVGANRPRMLSLALPHVDAWNTWYTHYGNTAEGFAEHNAWVSEQAARVGRDPGEVERSACVLVRLEGGVDLRAEKAPPVEAGALHDHLQALAEAGADEAILVANPITEESIRTLAEAM
jgi:alkanesulfonate monooxygenase SsuD/methylene tetrahydromethanopterin reductase-like flavin-dependent oxidoreductase (luciferase family)